MLPGIQAMGHSRLTFVTSFDSLVQVSHWLHNSVILKLYLLAALSQHSALISNSEKRMKTNCSIPRVTVVACKAKQTGWTWMCLHSNKSLAGQQVMSHYFEMAEPTTTFGRFLISFNNDLLWGRLGSSLLDTAFYVLRSTRCSRSLDNALYVTHSLKCIDPTHR